ncbi:unnamed protein product [Caenorhabditis angaria]|uniref:Uncharacterized protein n=1 Tax=Caenorhabditis angaria TaxID=860376 RepID=A0A9P1IPM4_9PELO|nr:unnamed protein product [Caenorhabditis angaria]
MTEEAVQVIKDEEMTEIKAEQEANVENEVENGNEEKENGNGDDIVTKVYAQHGGDPRLIDISYCVLLSQLPTDFMADTYDQFAECIRNLLADEHKLDPSALSQIVRIPKLEADISETNSVRALLCFTEKTHKHRMMGRKKDFETAGMRVETLDTLPTDFLEFTDEDVNGIEENSGASYEMADEIGEDDEDDNNEEEEVETKENEHGEDELEYDETEENENNKKEDESEENGKDNSKTAESDEKRDDKKKKVYEDEDAKVEFETVWEGAPEFQWRIVEGSQDEKRLVIENMFFSDLQNVFMYRCMTRALKVDINVPTRYSSDGSRVLHVTMSLTFSGPFAIMEEALTHLVYFRSPDGRRIKILLPQTPGSLKRKEELEKKLGRVIKATPRMKELVVKVLPENFEPSLDLACSWFPLQSVIGCDLLHDEWGQPCAVIKFETAEEAIAAHAYKAIVKISTKTKKVDKDGEEKEETKLTNCNVYMRGVEAHFGSLLTNVDIKKKWLEEKAAKRPPPPPKSMKRPAGSTIRAPITKKTRNSSPLPPRSAPRPSRGTPTRGGPRNGPRGGGGRGPPPFVSRPRSPPGRRAPPVSSSRGRGPPPRSIPPRSSYSSSSSSSRPSGRPVSGFGGSGNSGSSSSAYGYQSDRYNERPHIDPFGRPTYSSGGGGNRGGYSSSAFARSDQDRYMELAYGSGMSSLPDWTSSSQSTEFSSRRRY